MPTLSALAQYGLPVGAQVVGGLLNRRSLGRTTAALTGGVDRSRELIDTGARTAQNQIQQGSAQAANTLGTTYQNAQNTLKPFQEAGAGSLGTLSEGVKPGGDFNNPFNANTFDLYKDPSFQFRLEQGQRAINRAAGAGLNRFSGATLKSLSNYNQGAASQEYQNAFNRHQTDTQGRFGRVREVAGIGETAAGREVTAGSQYGTNLANLQNQTAESTAQIESNRAASIANLEIERANAEAMGETEKANSITDTINGIMNTVDQVGTVRSLANLAKGAAPTAAAVTGGLTTAAALAPTAASLAIPAAPLGLMTAPGAMVTGGVAGGGTAASGAAAAGGTGGFGATVGAFLTNPITIAAGAALGIGLLVRRAQGHHKANDFVNTLQNPFDKTMAGIDQQVQSGQLSPEDATALKKANVNDYLRAMNQFAQKGNDHRTVARQALETFRMHYGDPNQYAA